MQRLEQAVTNFQPPPQFKAFINRFERLEDGEPYFLLFNQVDDLTMDLLRNIICILKTDASDIITPLYKFLISPFVLNTDVLRL